MKNILSLLCLALVVWAAEGECWVQVISGQDVSTCLINFSRHQNIKIHFFQALKVVHPTRVKMDLNVK